MEHGKTTENRKPFKRTVKDSVFTNLFREKKYLLELYQALHPEDLGITEDQLTDVTIRNVLVDQIYNDVGFMVGDRMVLLVEAQSTWSLNIVVRQFLYLAQTCRRYLVQTNQNLCGSKKVRLPRPELYMIYTGERKDQPDEISLSEEFFGGAAAMLDVKVKVIYDGENGDIIHQYVRFARVCNEQIRQYGRTKQAILETIRICREEHVLEEYLKSREQEVVSIMDLLYDEEVFLNMYIDAKVQEAAEEAAQKATEAAKQAEKQTAIKMVIKLLQMGRLTVEEIASCVSDMSVEDVKRIEKSILQEQKSE